MSAAEETSAHARTARKVFGFHILPNPDAIKDH